MDYRFLSWEVEAVKFLLAFRGSVHSQGCLQRQRRAWWDPGPIFHPRDWKLPSCVCIAGSSLTSVVMKSVKATTLPSFRWIWGWGFGGGSRFGPSPSCLYEDLRGRLSLLKMYLFIYLFCFLGPSSWHMEVPRLGVESSCSCNLYHNSQQHQILNPLSKTRDQICVLMDAIQICFHWAMMGTPKKFFLVMRWKPWGSL